MQTDQITLAIVIITGAIFVSGLVSFTLVARAAFHSERVGAAKSLGLLFQRGNFLRIATVGVVILAVIFLAVLGKLDEGATAVLSGVAGYVLGGLEKGHEEVAKTEDASQ